MRVTIPDQESFDVPDREARWPDMQSRTLVHYWLPARRVGVPQFPCRRRPGSTLEPVPPLLGTGLRSALPSEEHEARLPLPGRIAPEAGARFDRLPDHDELIVPDRASTRDCDHDGYPPVHDTWVQDSIRPPDLPKEQP